MPVTRIIIIFTSAASSGVGLVVLLIAGLFLMMFLGDGDGEPGTVNTISHSTFCAPTVELFKAALAADRQISAAATRGAVSEDHAEKEWSSRLKNLGGTKLVKGTKAKVMETPATINGFPSPALREGVKLVQLLEDPKRQCYVRGAALEMGFFDWMKWKWEKNAGGGMEAIFVFNELNRPMKRKIDRAGKMEVYSNMRVQWYACGQVVGPAVLGSHKGRPAEELKRVDGPSRGWAYYEFSDGFLRFLTANDIRGPLEVEFTAREVTDGVPNVCPRSQPIEPGFFDRINWTFWKSDKTEVRPVLAPPVNTPPKVRNTDPKDRVKAIEDSVARINEAIAKDNERLRQEQQQRSSKNQEAQRAQNNPTEK